jgi:nitrite reductase/ring-hydroxylating ferredoxin subunit
MRSLLLPFALFGLALVVLVGCKKEERGGVPLTPVDISINVNNPSYADLQVPGGWLYLTGGSMGLIVYRTSMESFVAMDRHCTYNPAQLCRVFVDESQLIAQDTVCCQSKFLITDGTVVQGPAAINLQRYNTTFNGTTLRIFN